MARNCATEKWEDSKCKEEEEEEEEGEEEEALSLSDLPVSLMNEEKQSRKEEAQVIETVEEFDFGSWGGSLLTESEMCAADEVFFQGQILPLRLSVSSDNGMARLRNDSRNPSRCNSRSESMDHGSLGGLTSVSSRSSSIGSHNSSSCSSSSTLNTTTTTTTTTTYKSRVRNQFHTHPSPKPQIRVSTTRPGNVGSRSPKSTVWSFFRVGLARTPEIELQDLKLRSNTNNTTNKSFGSRNSSSSSSNSSCSTKNSKINSFNDGTKSNHGLKVGKQKRLRFFDKNGGLLSGCKCSVGAVGTVPSKIVIIKSSTGNSTNVSESRCKEETQQQTNMKKQQQGKQAMSRHRTFEWLKELALAGTLEEA